MRGRPLHTIAPPDLVGFVEHQGIRLAALDGGVFAALGHHDTEQFLAALEAHAAAVYDTTLADLHPAAEPDLPACVGQFWAVLMSACGQCADRPDCEVCGQIRRHPWWINWDGVDSLTPGSFPVTIYQP